jgi:hypothetical protein
VKSAFDKEAAAVAASFLYATLDARCSSRHKPLALLVVEPELRDGGGFGGFFVGRPGGT